MAPENTLREESQHLARKLQWGRSRVAPDNNTYDTTGFPLYLLQWGRSQSAPENLRDLAAFVQVDRDASMGPEPIGSGKHLPWLLRSSCIIVLQWGRSQSAPENGGLVNQGPLRSGKDSGERSVGAGSPTAIHSLRTVVFLPNLSIFKDLMPLRAVPALCAPPNRSRTRGGPRHTTTAVLSMARNGLPMLSTLILTLSAGLMSMMTT